MLSYYSGMEWEGETVLLAKWMGDEKLLQDLSLQASSVAAAAD